MWTVMINCKLNFAGLPVRYLQELVAYYSYVLSHAR